MGAWTEFVTWVISWGSAETGEPCCCSIMGWLGAGPTGGGYSRMGTWCCEWGREVEEERGVAWEEGVLVICVRVGMKLAGGGGG